MSYVIKIIRQTDDFGSEMYMKYRAILNTENMHATTNVKMIVIINKIDRNVFLFKNHDILLHFGISRYSKKQSEESMI